MTVRIQASEAGKKYQYEKQVIGFLIKFVILSGSERADLEDFETAACGKGNPEILSPLRASSRKTFTTDAVNSRVETFPEPSSSLIENF